VTLVSMTVQRLMLADAPFHPVPGAWAGPSLLAMIVFEIFVVLKENNPLPNVLTSHCQYCSVLFRHEDMIACSPFLHQSRPTSNALSLAVCGTTGQHDPCRGDDSSRHPILTFSWVSWDSAYDCLQKVRGGVLGVCIYHFGAVRDVMKDLHRRRRVTAARLR
jgi:hypothetical protein